MSVTIFVPDLPDFMPLVQAVRSVQDVQLIEPRRGYWRICASSRISFSRKGLGLRVALWYSMLAGGFTGRITEYGRDILTIESEA
jgi:hypothetical protein